MNQASHANPQGSQASPPVPNRAVTAALAVLCLAAPAASAQGPAAQERLEREHRLALDGAGHVRVEHLAGPVSVEAHDADEVVVRMVVQARGESAPEARRLAEAVVLQHKREGDALRIRAMPPLDEHHTLFYVPPGAGAGFSRQAQFAGRRVTVRGATRWGRPGMHLHVALHLALPRGIGLDLEQHAGPVAIRGLQGPVRARLRGDALQVDGVEGPLDVDSGNGSVEITGHRGAAQVVTGSAGMRLHDSRGGPYRLRSGSGHIRLQAVTGSVSAETGSGGVSTTAFGGGERVAITGSSGDVDLQGDFSAVRDLVVTTSSGDIHLRPSGAVHAGLEIESVRGTITVELPGQAQVRDNRNRYSAVAGEGLGRWKLESRTGRIRIVSDPGDSGMRDLFEDG